MIELKLFHILTFSFCNIHYDIIVPHVSGPNGLCASICALQFVYTVFLISPSVHVPGPSILDFAVLSVFIEHKF